MSPSAANDPPRPGDVPAPEDQGDSSAHDRIQLGALVPCTIGALIFSIAFAYQSIHFGVQARGAVPLICIYALCVWMARTGHTPGSVAPAICLNSALIAALLAWAMDNMVSLTVDDMQEKFLLAAAELQALGKVKFREGANLTAFFQEAVVSKGHSSETVFVSFLAINVLQTALALMAVHSRAIALATPRATHRAVVLVIPILNSLVFVLVLLLSSNVYQTWLCVTECGMLALALLIREWAWPIAVQQPPAVKQD